MFLLFHSSLTSDQIQLTSKMMTLINSFPLADAFWSNSSRRLLKTLWPKMKLLIILWPQCFQLYLTIKLSFRFLSLRFQSRLLQNCRMRERVYTFPHTTNTQQTTLKTSWQYDKSLQMKVLLIMSNLSFCQKIVFKRRLLQRHQKRLFMGKVMCFWNVLEIAHDFHKSYAALKSSKCRMGLRAFVLQLFNGQLHFVEKLNTCTCTI